ncbi:MAG TPA: alcohol dehydrogenase catalytic domain-containing protein [Lacisediminihabitans sp.]|uniref:alcohol dehydrogenase catalytic domain-containing protein n=1 Tax=Lacisediminihabitans sp. TaxID=2787631 RepID=UPI002ED80612
MMTTNTSSETVTAVVSRAGGPLDGPDSLMDATIPAPGDPTGHDILVEVIAVSVNPVDVKARASGNPEQKDRVLGWDAAGTVIAVGEQVTLFEPGDEPPETYPLRDGLAHSRSSLIRLPGPTGHSAS